MPTPALWTRENLAWCAGIIEGEGSIHTEGGGLRVAVQMTDLDVLIGLQNVLGGRLYGPTERPGCKPIWKWEISRNAQAYAALMAVHGWLRQRRRDQVSVAVEHWLRTGRERLAHLAECKKCGGIRKNRRIHGVRQGWICRPCASQRARERRIQVGG